MIRVIFRKDKRDNDVTAFFPETLRRGKIECYAHIGQHSEADVLYYMQETKPATREEFEALHMELIAIGYRDLVINKRLPRRN